MAPLSYSQNKKMRFRFNNTGLYVCSNVSFQIVTKVCTNRVIKVEHLVVRPTQTTFMPGRHTLEGVLILHEMIHELHRKKMDGVLFKIDFDTAYDKVKWPFFQQVLPMKGFDPKWCK
jgi:mannosylglycoprotein endo-beta-mannosidase